MTTDAQKDELRREVEAAQLMVMHSLVRAVGSSRFSTPEHRALAGAASRLVSAIDAYLSADGEVPS